MSKLPLFALLIFTALVHAAPEKDKTTNRECYKCNGNTCNNKSLETVQCGNTSCMKRKINGTLERVKFNQFIRFIIYNLGMPVQQTHGRAIDCLARSMQYPRWTYRMLLQQESLQRFVKSLYFTDFYSFGRIPLDSKMRSRNNTSTYLIYCTLINTTKIYSRTHLKLIGYRVIIELATNKEYH
jgi:hypothetical protein